MLQTNRSATSIRFVGLMLIAVMALFAVACAGTTAEGSGNNTTPNPNTTPAPDTIGYSPDPKVNDLLASMKTWNPPVTTSEDTRQLRAGAFREGSYNYQCTVDEGQSITRKFDEFPAVAFQGSLAPGLFIDGQELLNGKIQAIPLDRAPIDLVISLASQNPVVHVDAPSTATIQRAVSTLQRDADSRLSGIDVVPADIEYVRKEAYSFEQTALELGFSVRYDGPLAQAGLDVAFSSNNSFEQHTILVRMVQPMYTISFVDDHVFEPRQLLGPNVTSEEVSAAIAAGRLQEDRPAVYVKSVTYGRTMLFTMTSTQVDKTSDLLVAMNAAYGAWSGSGEVSKHDREVLANTEIRMVAVGGNTANAEAAIKSANPSDYFNGADTANAAPLSFRVATLGGSQAAVEDLVSFQKQDCSRTPYVAPKPTYSFRFVLSQVEGWADIRLGDAVKKEVSGDGWNQGKDEYTFSGSNLPAGNQAINIHFGRAFCVDSKVDVKLYVNGVFADEQFWNGCAFDGTFGYSINKDTGKWSRK
ncbi:MAG: thiol-activated cytolysin family protein [Dehalococcoidia bacterium]